MADGMARVVVGRYRLTGPLGRGGMGAVWRAHDTLLGRDVAIKEIWLPSTGDGPVDPADPFVRRALREAQAAARLRHPGIVTVYDVVTDQGRPWIVMELIEGRSLAETIQEHGLLTEQRTAEIGVQVLDALRAAHREGIAHRDVKPANILLDVDRVVLTDFGIAAIEDATALTATGQVVGSPAYMSPERINGQPVTAAADLWALGVTLYTAVTGRSPFQREDTQATLAAILQSQPATPAHAGRLWPVIKGLLIKDPASRLGTEPARQLLTNVARPAGSPAPAPARRRPRWWPPKTAHQQATRDGGPPETLAAPPPTQALPTAIQEPEPGQGSAAAKPDPRPVGSPETTATHDAGADAAVTQAGVMQPAVTEAVTEKATVAQTVGPAVVPPVQSPAPPAQSPAPPDVQAVPLAPYPETAGRPRAVRARAVWLAAVAVAAMLLAGGLLGGPWRGSGNEGDGASAGGRAIASGPSAKPSVPPSMSVNPALDGCVVGTWEMTSMQVINHFENRDALFTSSGGLVSRIWPDGKSVDDYSKLAPLTATINGHKYVEVLRGIKTFQSTTKGGNLRNSGFSGGPTYKVTRDGRKQSIQVRPSSAYNLPYTCTEDLLATYGNEKVSTQSFKRISHDPCAVVKGRSYVPPRCVSPR